jgi:hypothetical protein
MKKRTAVMLLVWLLAVGSACSATPKHTGYYQARWTNPVDVVKLAGLKALTIYGFEITENEALYIEGYLPRTWWGKLCAPGGETTGVWLEEMGPSMTRVSKSLFGVGCQKDWTDPVLDEMFKILRG